MRVTILDVAKRAGVSHTTVSWAIHDRPEISAETKEKVFKAIKELNYHPNYLARSLVKGKTNTIAIVATFFSSTFEMEILKGIEQSINSMKSTYTITLFSTLGQHEKVLSDIVYSKRADGVILMSIKVPDNIVELYKSNDVPLMVIDEEAPGALEVKLDNFKGAYIATEHLIKSGRKNLSIVLGDGGNLGLSQSERKRGFLKAIENYGLKFDETKEFRISDYYFEEGLIVFKRMVRVTNDVDGIFCAAGDVVATGIMLEARNQGIKIPEQLSIIGYDDIISSALLSPPLTTVRQPLVQIGRNAYETVVRVLENGNAEGVDRLVYEPQLVIRNSV